MPTRKSQSQQVLKRTIKYLAVCQKKHPKEIQAILKHSPDNVVKSICNAAVNAYRGNLSLSPKARKEFHSKRKVFELLCNKKIPLNVKRRKLVNQKGGAFPALIPILLSTVLSAVGSAFFSKS